MPPGPNNAGILRLALFPCRVQLELLSAGIVDANEVAGGNYSRMLAGAKAKRKKKLKVKWVLFALDGAQSAFVWSKGGNGKVDNNGDAAAAVMLDNPLNVKAVVAGAEINRLCIGWEVFVHHALVLEIGLKTVGEDRRQKGGRSEMA